MSDQVDELYARHEELTHKFDYFVLGATGAACAYILQTFRPTQLAVSPNTLELVALLALLASVYCGFRRIELGVTLARGNFQLREISDDTQNLTHAAKGSLGVQFETSGRVWTAADVAKRLDALAINRKALGDVLGDVTKRSKAWYQWRNRLIVAGVLALVFARVWGAYV